MDTLIVGLFALITGTIIGYVLHGLYPYLWVQTLKRGYNRDMSKDTDVPSNQGDKK